MATTKLITGWVIPQPFNGINVKSVPLKVIFSTGEAYIFQNTDPKSWPIAHCLSCPEPLPEKWVVRNDQTKRSHFDEYWKKEFDCYPPTTPIFYGVMNGEWWYGAIKPREVEEISFDRFMFWTTCPGAQYRDAQFSEKIEEIMTEKYAVNNGTKPIKAKPVFYACCYEPLKEIARDMGYNLLINGSLNRDMDLVAIPWIDNPAQPIDVVIAFDKYLRGTQYTEDSALAGYLHSVLPVGRTSFVINLNRGGPWNNYDDKQWYIDISFTPCIPKVRQDYGIDIKNISQSGEQC